MSGTEPEQVLEQARQCWHGAETNPARSVLYMILYLNLYVPTVMDSRITC